MGLGAVTAGVTGGGVTLGRGQPSKLDDESSVGEKAEDSDASTASSVNTLRRAVSCSASTRPI
jgi:hypothetical protein